MGSKILAAIDLEHRDNAIKALREADKLAKSNNAELHVCYVLAYGFYTFIKPYLAEEVVKDTIDHAKAEMRSVIEAADLDADATVAHILKGGVHQQILLLIEQIKPDYLVMNAAQPDAHGGMTGPVTAQISRYAPCSLLIVR